MSLPTTSSSVSDAAHVTQWMFDIARPYVKGRTLEIGSGQGEISYLFVENKIPLHLSDMDQINREKLREKFDCYPEVRNIHRIDFHEINFDEVYSNIFGAFGTIFKLNLSQRPIDAPDIAKINLLLREGGHLIALMPAYTTLYNGLDADWRELKKYNRGSVIDLLGNSFDVLKTRYFSLPSSGSSSAGQIGLSSIVVARKKEMRSSDKQVKL
jgi:hypothetical protein